MAEQVFEREIIVPATAAESFAWHERDGAFERLTPPWEPVQVAARQGTILDGDVTTLRMKLGPIGLKWVARHHDYQENVQFADEQIKGPFRKWDHTHRFENCGSESKLTDHIEYRLPGGAIGRLLGGRMVRRKLARMFAYRHRLFGADIRAHLKDRQPMHIAITGASGLVGSALKSFLTTGGHRVTSLVRHESTSSNEVQWDPARGVLDPTQLDGIDALIHLAGENIGEGRWTAKKKQRIRDSRVDATQKLVASLSNMDTPPSTFICASAIGYYGDRGDEVLDESASPGEGFLAQLVQDWESAAREAEAFGSRVVLARLGVVLSPECGALKKMMTPFRLGLGGPIGSGKQIMSWVSLQDAVGAIHHALMTDSIHGPINITAPRPVSNKEFGKTLGKTLRRPAFLPLPAFAARLAFGEMANELLLSSTHAAPKKLIASGYDFRDEDLGTTLRWMLGGMTEPEMKSVHV